ncbi:MAG: hypothetical protein ACI85B_002262 [Flavobacteriaceae bacterium]|jgi:hypothetical protein
MLSKSKASPYKLTLILSFILSDYIYKTKDCKLKTCIIKCLIEYARVRFLRRTEGEQATLFNPTMVLNLIQNHCGVLCK